MRNLAPSLIVVLVTLAGCVQVPERQALRAQHLAEDLNAPRLLAPPPPSALTVDDAVEYALTHNLNLWVARRERMLRDELARGARLDMLPSLMSDAELSRRSEVAASTSVSLDSGDESLEPSYSAEKTKRTLDITVAWNLVDFGVAYFRSRQAANRMAIADEQFRRARQRLILDVRAAYWRAAATREAARLANSIQDDIQKLRVAVLTAVENRSLSEIEALERETPLLEQSQRLGRYQREYHNAIAELASLLGAPAGVALELGPVGFDDDRPDLSLTDKAALEREALEQRPELFVEDREQLISADDARIAVAQLLPSPALFARYESDGNPHLYYDHWYTAGLRASWDLLRIPSKLAQRRAAKSRTEMARDRRLALSAGILTQLHIALIEYDDARRRILMSQEIADKRGRLVEALENSLKQGKGDAGRLLDERLKYLAARARYLLDVAAIEGARARVENTLGRDPGIASSVPPAETDLRSAPPGDEADSIQDGAGTPDSAPLRKTPFSSAQLVPSAQISHAATLLGAQPDSGKDLR